jgi:hypothetical protein
MEAGPGELHREPRRSEQAAAVTRSEDQHHEQEVPGVPCPGYLDRGCQAASLNRREMLADAIHFPDGGIRMRGAID